MVAKAARNDGVSLLKNDVVAKESATSGDEPLNLSGALDILWQIKDKNQSQHTIVQMDIEPFMVEFFEKVAIYCWMEIKNRIVLL
jgi:hypothetical protein